MIGKIVKAIGIEKDVYECDKCGEAIAEPNGICPNCGCKKVKVMTNYEKFRREHSLILNQKILRGNLCLSIHPLDYITMSDNACGWDSCMRWMDDPGDYRLGTIEMMMSKYVVVAYLESKDNMVFGHPEYEWNSKRWRQLIVVTPELILANKQYPYENDTLQGAAIKWMRDLAETDTNFGPYQKEACQIENHSNNQIGEHKVRITLNFNYMYNDIYYTRLSYIQEGFNENYLEYNLSGPAICTSCFEEIPYDTVDPSGTVCRNCGGQFRCDCCGGWHYGEPYYDDNGNTYCEYCYYNELEECEICNSRHSNDEIQNIFIHLADTEDPELECENWNYCIPVCYCCINSTRFFKLFGPVYTNVDMWGRTRNCVSVANFTDAGFRSGNLSQWDINYLTKLRDVGNNEDRVALIKENLC
jgi:hypothetical protein